MLDELREATHRRKKTLMVRCRRRISALALVLVVFLVTAVTELHAANPPREGYSKVLVGKLLFAQPDATAAPSVLAGLDATILEEYEANLLASVRTAQVATVQARGRQARLDVHDSEHFDHLYVAGRRLDTRLGTERSFPARSVDAPYRAGEMGTWVIQFVGPIKPQWVSELSAAGVVFVQYLAYNGYIVAGSRETMKTISGHSFVQFIDQFHASLKPTVGATESEVLLWIQLAQADTTDETVGILERMSVSGIQSSPWSRTEVRVEGSFRPADLETIVRLPLVIAVTRRPEVGMSGEREALSLTSVTPGTGGGRYKNWLADICEVCGNLQADGYYIGIADLGVDGGFHAQAASIAGEPNSSDQHRDELAKSRLVRGTQFESSDPPWDPASGKWPDSTNSLHDVNGHGTMVAAIAAGNPPPTGSVDGDRYFYGMGVAPTAGLVVSKINVRRIAEGNTAIRDVVQDARLNPTQRAYIQNHSYNQYTFENNLSCGQLFDGYYTTLSRDFDQYARDADPATPALEQTLLTVSSGNTFGQAFPHYDDQACWEPRKFLALPPATAKNVLALGMAENRRGDSALWNCWGGLAESYDNIASNSKRGTANPGWYKPDLTAVASDITSLRTSDLAPPPVGDDYCQNGGALNPALPAEYFSSSGTSFAAPAAAGAAILASRYYAARVNGNASSASPALLKAMLVAGARSMRGGLDRGKVRAWRPQQSHSGGDLVIPRRPGIPPDDHVYKLQFSGTSSAVEPNWLPSGTTLESSGLRWDRVQAEEVIGGFPNDRQGFGRLHLEDVLSSYPSRDLLPAVAAPLPAAAPWTRAYKVHDGNKEVRIVIAWTDLPREIPQPDPDDPPYITGIPLVNDLDLSVELGTPCTVRYLGNRMSDDVSTPYAGCTETTFDRMNNMEVIRFSAAESTVFTVKVGRYAGTEPQDFAIVAYNAYESGQPAPPVPPANFRATAASLSTANLSWSAASGADSYDVQRSNHISMPFVTIASGITTTSYSNSGLEAGKAYLYRVRSRKTGSPVVAASEPDVATTVPFADDPVVARITPIRAQHVTQLRTAASAVRDTAGLAASAWAEGIVPLQTTVKASHFTELRDAIDAALQVLGITTSAYTDPLIPEVTPIRAVHVNELRDRIR